VIRAVVRLKHSIAADVEAKARVRAEIETFWKAVRRGQALEALAILANWGEVPRDTIEDYFLWLVREGLEREFSQVWNNLCSSCLDIEALRVFPELRRAYEEGLIESGFVSLKNLKEVEDGPRGKWIERQRERHPPITDVARATSWWGCFKREPRMSAEPPAEFVRSLHESEPGQPAAPYIALAKVGRNERCPCGSGKKYKKCCGA